jgi:hypothetical protein
MRLSFSILAPVALLSLAGCSAAVAPPRSPFPDAASAVSRMRATVAGCVALQANDAKIDHRGQQGRVRGNLSMFVAVPESIRMDVISPFGVTLATLASDGRHFSLADLRDNRFYVGRASACNLARLTGVPVPAPVLVDLLRGVAPVLVHPSPSQATIAWSSRGYYVMTITGADGNVEEVHLTPPPEDFAKNWSEQRVRVLSVEVRQRGDVWYRAELADHARAPMAGPRVDPEGIDPPIPVSGPACQAELPKRIHVEVPWLAEDVLFRYEQVFWNPPLPHGLFEQQARPGLTTTPVTCD